MDDYYAIAYLIGKRIREVREERNLSQIELGKLVNLDHSTISDYERGRRVPSMVVGFRLAIALQVPANEFWPQ